MRARAVYRLSAVFLAALTVLNLSLSVLVLRKMRQAVQLNINVHEAALAPSVPSAPSLVLPGDASGSAPAVPVPLVNSSPLPAPQHWSIPYRYFVNGVPGAMINGVAYYRGSRHAYGVVLDIYPERIFFEGGSYIDNSIREVSQNANSPAVSPLP